MLKAKNGTRASVLCVFWEEEGEWIGMALDTSITVCGDTLDEAVAHMREGIDSHLTTLQETGQIEELQRVFEASRKSVETLPIDLPIFKLPIPPALAKPPQDPLLHAK